MAQTKLFPSSQLKCMVGEDERYLPVALLYRVYNSFGQEQVPVVFPNNLYVESPLGTFVQVTSIHKDLVPFSEMCLVQTSSCRAAILSRESDLAIYADGELEVKECYSVLCY